MAMTLKQLPGDRSVALPGSASNRSPQANSPGFFDGGASLFVWATWALLLLTDLALIWQYRVDVPIWDEWDYLVPVLTGEQPVTLAWLWLEDSPHRMPLIKLLFVALAQVPGFEITGGSFFNALAAGAGALVMIWAARRLRGWTSYADAFLPLVLMNPSLGCFFNSVSPNTDAILMCGLLAIIVVNPTLLTLRTAALAGVILMLLPLTGATGAAELPALALWLGYVGVRHWQSSVPRGKYRGLLILTLVSAALLILLLAYLGIERSQYKIYVRSSRPGLLDWLKTGLQFLSVSFGSQAKHFWPLSGLVMLILLLISVLSLAAVWLQQPLERYRCLGLFLFLSALTTLALAVGWGRPTGFQAFYIPIAVPVLCCVYFVWGLHGGPSSRFVQMGLFTLACVLFSLDLQGTLSMGRSYRERATALECDLLAGRPPSILAERHSYVFYPHFDGGRERMAAWLASLHDAGIGKFRLLQKDPAFQEVVLPVEPASANERKGGKGASRGFGRVSSLVLGLGHPRFVYAIRLKYSYENMDAASDPALFQLFWKRGDQDGFCAAQSESLFLPFPPLYGQKEGRENSVTIWVNDTIDQIRIGRDNKPFAFGISEVVLLVPENRSEAARK